MPIITIIRPTRRGERGSELIEFALVFMLLQMVFLGIVDFAFLLQRHEVISNAAVEGARVAVLPGYGQTDVQARVASYLAAGGVPTTATNPTVTVTPTTMALGGGTWPATTVALDYTHDYLFIGTFVSWFGGSLGNVTLESDSTMRNEVDPSP